MSDILRYDENDTVTINFGNIIFANDKNMPYIDNCYIPISKWGLVKNYIDSQIKLNKNEKEQRKSN